MTARRTYVDRWFRTERRSQHGLCGILGQRSPLSRWRRAACLARLPHVAMLHHRLTRLLVWSAKIRVQRCPSHALILAKSSSHTHRASASAIGSNRDSAIASAASFQAPDGAGARSATWLNFSSERGACSEARGADRSGANGRPICSRTKPLNHSRKARACSATLSSSPGAACGQRSQRSRRNQLCFSEPRNQAVAAVEPVNRRVDRRRD